MKFIQGRYYHQAYTDSYALTLEVRANGKVKAIKYNDFTNRATIGFIQNWHPEPALVNADQVPVPIRDKMVKKWGEMK